MEISDIKFTVNGKCGHTKDGVNLQEVDRIDLPPSGMISIPAPDGRGRREIRLGVLYIIKYHIEDAQSSPLVTLRLRFIKLRIEWIDRPA